MIFRQCSVGGKIYTGDGLPPSHPTIAHQHQPPPVHQHDDQDDPIAKSASESDDSDPKKISTEDPDEIKVTLPKEVLATFHEIGRAHV